MIKTPCLIKREFIKWEAQMINFKGICLAFNFFLLVCFQWNAFGILDPNTVLEDKTNFVSQAFSSGKGEKREAPALFVEVQGEYCVIPLNKADFQSLIEGQSARVLKTWDIQKGLKQCPSEIRQLAWDSLENKGNQVAVGAVPVVLGSAIYGGFCIFADHKTNKRERVQPFADYETSLSEAFIRFGLAVACLPVYALGALIRWSR